MAEASLVESFAAVIAGQHTAEGTGFPSRSGPSHGRCPGRWWAAWRDPGWSASGRRWAPRRRCGWCTRRGLQGTRCVGPRLGCSRRSSDRSIRPRWRCGVPRTGRRCTSGTPGRGQHACTRWAPGCHAAHQQRPTDVAPGTLQASSPAAYEDGRPLVRFHTARVPAKRTIHNFPPAMTRPKGCEPTDSESRPDTGEQSINQATAGR